MTHGLENPEAPPPVGKSRSKQSLWWLSLASRGLDLTSRKLDLTKKSSKSFEVAVDSLARLICHPSRKGSPYPVDQCRFYEFLDKSIYRNLRNSDRSLTSDSDF